MPIIDPTLAQMTPMVAAVPRAVPVKTETAQLSRNATRRNECGTMACAARYTIMGMAPEARHMAVMMPIRPKTISRFLTLQTPWNDMRTTFATPWPLYTPYPTKRK